METTPVDTSVQVASTLTRLVVIKFFGEGYAHYDDAGFVLVGEHDVFSTRVKIEAEPAKSNRRYVNLRFCYTNKYWAWKASDIYIVAESNKPEEDKTKETCTLFEAVKVKDDEFYLIHVQSGGRLLIDSVTMRFYLSKTATATTSLSFVNWKSLVKLPKHVAFKGYNGKYLQGVLVDGYNYLQFSSDDPNAEASGHEVHLRPDGHVWIKSDHWGKYWKYETDWIWADSIDPSADGQTTLFLPVRVNSNTIALRSAGGNNRFCNALTTEGKTDCLDAGVTTITSEARIVVEELVLGRRISDVRYWLENARIYNETPYIAGTTTAFNYTDAPTTVAVELNYLDTKTQSFSHSYSLDLGVKASFTAGVPLITSEGIEVSAKIGVEVEWGNTTSYTVSIKGTDTVPVPAKTKASINYVGTKAMCDVPFSYTQEDTSSTDGKITETQHIDGVFTGINAYNFSFVTEKTTPL